MWDLNIAVTLDSGREKILRCDDRPGMRPGMVRAHWSTKLGTTRRPELKANIYGGPNWRGCGGAAVFSLSFSFPSPLLSAATGQHAGRHGDAREDNTGASGGN